MTGAASANDHEFWLAKFARLRIDTASGAPHKPLLLLVVLDLAQEGALVPSPSGRGQGEGFFFPPGDS